MYTATWICPRTTVMSEQRTRKHVYTPIDEHKRQWSFARKHTKKADYNDCLGWGEKRVQYGDKM